MPLARFAIFKCAEGNFCHKTDETAYICNEALSKLEEKTRKEFDTKEAKMLTEGNPVKFNGAVICRNGNRKTLSQPEKISKLNELDVTTVPKTQYVSERARGAYISAVCRPDTSYAFSIASMIQEPNEKYIKNLNKAIASMRSSAQIGLRFLPLHLDSLCIAVFVDAGFEANPDSSSQLGFIVTLMYKHGYANIIHYGSLKSKRVTRSVLAAELFAMVYGFDI